MNDLNIMIGPGTDLVTINPAELTLLLRVGPYHAWQIDWTVVPPAEPDVSCPFHTTH
jgi:hypothetical protein